MTSTWDCAKLILELSLCELSWKLCDAMIAIADLHFSMIWGTLFRTTVILTSGASVPGVVHHAPCLGSAGSAGSGSSPAVPQNHVLEDPYRSSAFGRLENVQHGLSFWCVLWKSIKIVVLLLKIIQNRWNALYFRFFFHAKSMKIVVLSFKIV